MPCEPNSWPTFFFSLIPKPSGSTHPTLLFDEDGLMFVVRTSQAEWLRERSQELYDAIQELLHHILSSLAEAVKWRGQERGPHLAVILGHSRQYGKVSSKGRNRTTHC